MLILKRIYSTGPFGDLYKITISNKLLNRCKEIQKWIRDSPLTNKEKRGIEVYKEIRGNYTRQPFLLIRSDTITIEVSWEEGYERITKYDTSIEDLPDVWFSDYLLYKLTDKEHNFEKDKKFRENFYKVIDEKDLKILKKIIVIEGLIK